MATIENIANAEICVSTFANPSKWTWLKLSDFDNAEQFLNEARQILGAAKNVELDFVDFSEIDEKMTNDLGKYFELEKEFNELDETEQQALTARMKYKRGKILVYKHGKLVNGCTIPNF